MNCPVYLLREDCSVRPCVVIITPEGIHFVLEKTRGLNALLLLDTQRLEFNFEIWVNIVGTML
jgi:hypothetical protein